ncbi:hypothetical protein ACFYNY_21200 [Streptomyces sp. NPDC006530]|uniref:hypothetical protein n=1 Tax=Streptomyces sp. NPDC006530 TaxID=3364750 RepID=UPI0036D00841
MKRITEDQIKAGPFRVGDRAATRAVLRAHALPQLQEVVAQATAADETWRFADHQHCWRLTDGYLTRRDEA